MSDQHWYSISNIETVPSPQLVIYTDRVLHNIQKAVEMIGDPSRLRPHIKTNKCREVVKMMMDAGIRKFKFATFEEGFLLGEENAPDALMAYQPVGPRIYQLIELVKKFPDTQFSCLVDNLEVAKIINDAFASEGCRIAVYIDLNVGMNRTGINEGAFELYKLCTALASLDPVGLHAYDGHIRDISFEVRKQKCNEAFKNVEILRDKMIKEGYPKPIVIVGGSPSFSVHASKPDVECSPGTFVFWDKGYSEICAEQPFIPAALVVTRVVSVPAKGKACLDLGHKSIAAENDITRRAIFLNKPAVKLLSQSEEHGIIEVGEEVKPGHVLYVLPYHICPTVNLFTMSYTVNRGIASSGWSIVAKH